MIFTSYCKTGKLVDRRRDQIDGLACQADSCFFCICTLFIYRNYLELCSTRFFCCACHIIYACSRSRIQFAVELITGFTVSESHDVLSRIDSRNDELIQRSVQVGNGRTLCYKRVISTSNKVCAQIFALFSCFIFSFSLAAFETDVVDRSTCAVQQTSHFRNRVRAECEDITGSCANSRSQLVCIVDFHDIDSRSTCTCLLLRLSFFCQVADIAYCCNGIRIFVICQISFACFDFESGISDINFCVFRLLFTCRRSSIEVEVVALYFHEAEVLAVFHFLVVLAQTRSRVDGDECTFHEVFVSRNIVICQIAP